MSKNNLTGDDDMKIREIKLKLKDTKAAIVYHKFQNFEVNTLLASFKEKRRILSTWDGYKEVRFVANNYQPPALSEITMMNYQEFEKKFPAVLGILPSEFSFLSTAANMENLALYEKSYQHLIVSCLATGGVGNALRAGVDKAKWM
jgi:adenosylcobinamide amidohydrolase